MKTIIEDYHRRQFIEPYRSTVSFEGFLRKHVNLGGVKVLDLACGGGANEYYFARKYCDSQWDGLDIDENLFTIFDEETDNIRNVRLMKGDWFNIESSLVGQYDGVISLQALSWLPEWKGPMEQICKLNPRFIALSSLFYEGDIEYTVNIKNYERPDIEKGTDHTKAFYNIYSIPRIKTFLADNRYRIFYAQPFEIDVDLPKPEKRDWGTYTIKTKEGRRLQLSAAMLMPWYFIYAERT